MSSRCSRRWSARARVTGVPSAAWRPTSASRRARSLSFRVWWLRSTLIAGSFRVMIRCASMTEDFYCDEALSGRTPIDVVLETDDVLAFHHTRPFWPVHIVVVPKRHIGSLLTLEAADQSLLLEMIAVIKQIAAQMVAEHGACRVLTNLGAYQDSKHLHWHVNAGEPLR